MQIQNEEATRIIRDGAKLTLSEGFPQVLLPNVVPVMDMTPRFHRSLSIYSIGTATSGNQTIYTGSVGKRAHVYGFQMSISKDAACDIATGAIVVQLIQGGTSRIIGSIAVITLTAEKAEVSCTFAYPIIADENTNIFCSGSFTAGVLRRSAIVYIHESIN